MKTTISQNFLFCQNFLISVLDTDRSWLWSKFNILQYKQTNVKCHMIKETLWLTHNTSKQLDLFTQKDSDLKSFFLIFWSIKYFLRISIDKIIHFWPLVDIRPHKLRATNSILSSDVECSCFHNRLTQWYIVLGQWEATEKMTSD